MATRISAAEAARSFTELLDRVRDKGEEFIIESDGSPICRLGPAVPKACTGAELARWWRTAPKPDPAYWDDVEQTIHSQPPLTDEPWPR